MVGVIGVNYRIFKALAKEWHQCVPCVPGFFGEFNVYRCVRNADADLACEVLNEEFAKEIEMGEISPIQAEKNLATVAIRRELRSIRQYCRKAVGMLGVTVSM